MGEPMSRSAPEHTFTVHHPLCKTPLVASAVKAYSYLRRSHGGFSNLPRQKGHSEAQTCPALFEVARERILRSHYARKIMPSVLKPIELLFEETTLCAFKKDESEAGGEGGAGPTTLVPPLPREGTSPT